MEIEWEFKGWILMNDKMFDRKLSKRNINSSLEINKWILIVV